MLGVLVNVIAIVVGGLLGSIFGKRINDRLREGVMNALSVCIIIVGIADALKSNNSLILILSVTLGTLLGTALKLDERIEGFGSLLERKLIKEEGSTFGQAFVTASMVFCIGAMVIYGSINAGLGNNETLYIKAVLDGMVSLLLSTTLGVGVCFSAIPVLLIQGVIALLSGLIAQYATEEFLAEVSGIGGVLVTTIGINLLGIKKIKTADMIPAVLGSLVVFLL